MEPRKLSALIFDNGDILFDASLWRRWLALHLTELGYPIGYEQLVVIWEQKLVPVYEGKSDYWVAFQALLKELSVEPIVAAEIIDSAKQHGQLLQSNRKPMPYVSETLAELSRRDVPLAVLSDSESGEFGVRKILRQLGLELYFNAVVSSKDVGFAKPSPLAYEAAANALECSLQSCGFVGHDIDELTGAMNVGMYAIAYNYHPDAPADLRVERFDQLLEMFG